jgi:hypothetical protein
LSGGLCASDENKEGGITAGTREGDNEFHGFVWIHCIRCCELGEGTEPGNGCDPESCQPDVAHGHKQGIRHSGIEEFLTPEGCFYAPPAKNGEL